MHGKCRIEDIHRTYTGNVVIALELTDFNVEELEEVKAYQELTVRLEKPKKKRSLDANAYFWVLCQKIAERLRSDKWTVYLLQLSKYGQFTDLAVYTEALPVIKSTFRYTEVLDEGEMNGRPSCMVRCYIGSSVYDTESMIALIEGTVQDAKDLGIETMTPDEISAMVAAWKGGNFDY